jgi:hypothetical protein
MLAGTGTLTGLAGCNASDDESSSSPDSEPTDTPVVGADSTPTDDATPAPTPTPEDQAPSLETATATPKDNGETLSYHVVAEDDQGLEYVAVRYGDQTQEWNSELGRQIDEDGQLTDLGQAPEDGQVVFVARDTADQETREERYPDQQAPSLSELQLRPTQNAEEITLTLQGEDNIGLKRFFLLLDDQSIHQQDVPGQSETTVDTTLDVSSQATAGEQNTLTARLEDWNGNTTQTDSDTYVRKYDVMEDTRLDIGTLYVPWAKGGNHCLEDIDSEATIGEYGEPIISSETTDQHIDQMTGHGINRVMFNYKGFENARNELTEFLESTLINQIELEPFYPIKNKRWVEDKHWKEEVLAPDMNDLKNRIMSRDNCAKYNGRPVIHLWNIHQLSEWGSERYNRKITEEWGNYENFVNDMRSHLSVDGTEPFIIGNILGAGIYGSEETETDMPPMTSLFDGLSTWTAAGVLESNSEVSWEETMNFVESNYEGGLNYAERNNMEFIPMVFPGFDDRANHCWGRDRYISRSLEKFTEMLNLAEGYETTGMIDIATWNDWPEGHQVEPGTWNGNEYGTDYLEVIKEFQS